MGVRVNCVAPGIIKTRFSEAVSGNFNYFVIILPNKIILRVIFRSWIGKFRDYHDYIFVSRTTRPKETTGCRGSSDHYVSCCYLAMNNGLLMCRRCFACAQCGPCLRWIPLKKLYRSNKNADLMIQQSLNSFCEIPWLSAWQFSYLFLPSTSACADNSFAYCL